MSSLSGKLAIIFGGSSGVGKAAAKQVVAAGGLAWIVARDAAKLAEAAKEINPANPAAVRTSSVDVTDTAATKAFFDTVEAGTVHFLVNTVGPSAGSSSILGEEGFAGLRRQFDYEFFA